MWNLLLYKFGERVSFVIRMALIAALAITVASVFAGVLYAYKWECYYAERALFVPRTLE